MSRELIEVPLNKLVASDRNVRRTGAADGIEELAASILAHGLLQPLLVSIREDGRYAVVAGARRLTVPIGAGGSLSFGDGAASIATSCRVFVAEPGLFRATAVAVLHIRFDPAGARRPRPALRTPSRTRWSRPE